MIIIVIRRLVFTRMPGNGDVPLVEFMYLIFTGESYIRRLESLLCLCVVGFEEFKHAKVILGRYNDQSTDSVFVIHITLWEGNLR